MSIFDRFIVVGHFKRKPVDQTVNNVPAADFVLFRSFGFLAPKDF
jgi:hypothetical protein